MKVAIVVTLFALCFTVGSSLADDNDEMTTITPMSDNNTELTPNQKPTTNLTILTIPSENEKTKNETETHYLPTVNMTRPTVTERRNNRTRNTVKRRRKGHRRNETSDDVYIEYASTELDWNETDDDEKIEEDSEEVEVENDDKFSSKPSEIVLDHIDFVQLRLKHIALSTSSNITELRLLQKKEFKKNEGYKNGWEYAWSLYNNSKKEAILRDFPAGELDEFPEDYHIAILSYTLQSPNIYSDFNKKTREVCSGRDIESYYYKSYFKLLLLAIQKLGTIKKFNSSNRFLYRGVSSSFKLDLGQILAFQQFTSTSTSLKIAENFAENTVFEMEGPFHGTVLSIKHHSDFEGEEEVLFSPLQVYQVDSIHVGKYYTRYVLKGYEFKMNDGEKCGFEPMFPINRTEFGRQLKHYSSTSLGNVKVSFEFKYFVLIVSTFLIIL